MTVSRLWASRPILAVLATLALSACSTTMASQPGVSSMDKGGMSMSCCPCCAKMKEQSQAGDKKSGCCCSGMMDGKDGCPCCGGGDGKPMICQPKN